MDEILDKMFAPELVLLNVEASDCEDLLRIASNHLYNHGYVTESYLDALIQRESVYPTGLPTPGVKVALPHTTTEYALRPGILMLNLKEPVAFKEMGNGVLDVMVDIVFVIVVSDAKEQVGVLKKMMGMFADEQALIRIKTAASPQEAFNLLRKWIDMDADRAMA